ncbi:CRISPR-associated endonuclease Cas2 [Thermostichus vulcanus]|uniref:CRISPR-associated endoribonuclease Cas2 n=1 Tax=Thermostichus vulcanus str. 'Rupite' TaxID=2813851 RepID=A0ABT0C6Y8_THEVL|nr:CRISPR-associated endonuclease Cas2 [Thermostichus vulcanus str. 'Rupite']
MFLYVVVYDTPSDKRRKKISDLLEGYGKRVQYSVFECVLDKDQFEELKFRLHKRIKSEEDSLRFYPLSSHTLGQVEIWGGPPLTSVPGSFIV